MIVPQRHRWKQRVRDAEHATQCPQTLSVRGALLLDALGASRHEILVRAGWADAIAQATCVARIRALARRVPHMADAFSRCYEDLTSLPESTDVGLIWGKIVPSGVKSGPRSADIGQIWIGIGRAWVDVG